MLGIFGFEIERRVGETRRFILRGKILMPHGKMQCIFKTLRLSVSAFIPLEDTKCLIE